MTSRSIRPNGPPRDQDARRTPSRGKRTWLQGRKLEPLVALLLMAIVFGASFPATKVALGSFTPVQVIFLRFSVSALLFLVLTPWFPMPTLDRQGCLGAFALATLEPIAYFFLEAEGLRHTLASTAAILISTIPVLVLILEAVLLRSRVLAREIVLVFVSIVGTVILLTAGGAERAVGGSARGNLLILAAALAASLYTVFARHIMTRYSPVAMTRIQSFYAAALYLPFAGWDFIRGAQSGITVEAVGVIVFLGLGCSFGGYLLLNYALSRVSATIVGAYANVIPVVATAIAFLFLGERLFITQLLGGVLVIGSVTILTARPGCKQRLDKA